MKILITGCAGFIGYYLSKSLSKKKDKIKKIINQKIDEVLEKKDEIVVDNDEEVWYLYSNNEK